MPGKESQPNRRIMRPGTRAQFIVPHHEDKFPDSIFDGLYHQAQDGSKLTFNSHRSPTTESIDPKTLRKRLQRIGVPKDPAKKLAKRVKGDKRFLEFSIVQVFTNGRLIAGVATINGHDRNHPELLLRLASVTPSPKAVRNS